MDTQKPIKLSIIIPTIGRTIELKEILQSIVLAKLSFSYEIIIVDQNGSGILDEVLKDFTVLPLQHYNVSFRGLSKAKNFGISKAAGRYLCFPDDDCRIFPETFSTGLETLENLSVDLVFGKCIDEDGRDSVLNFKKESSFITVQNMLGSFVEATAIVKKEVFDNFKYDENMGAGTFFGAEEGYDWLYRILKNSSFKAYYTPEIKFYHPQVILSKGDYASLSRVFKYRCGTAYLCKKHGFTMKFYKRLILARIAVIVYFLVNRNISRYYRVEVNALITGRIFAQSMLHECP